MNFLCFLCPTAAAARNSSMPGEKKWPPRPDLSLTFGGRFQRLQLLEELLHQRRDQPQGPSPEPVHQRQGFIGFHGHADTFFQCFVKICPDIPDHRILIDVHSALKIQILAPEVHIDGAHHCLFIVTDKGLGVDKAGQVLIDLHSGLH